MVSIIVPVYNAEKYLHKCVDALTAQSFNDIEIILVNDGSRDSSGGLCDMYAEKDSRIKVIHKQNGGVSSARNAGIEAANGDYIMFCDSDDHADKDWVKGLLDCAKGHPSCMPLCDIANTSVHGNIIDYNKMPDSEYSDGEVYIFEPDMIKELIRYAVLYYPNNKIYIASIIKENGLKFDNSISLGEDGLFVFEYLCYVGGCTVYLHKPLYMYVDANEESLTKVNKKAHADSIVRALDAYMKLLNKLGIDSQENITDAYSLYYTLFINNILDCAKEKRDSRIQRLKIIISCVYIPEFMRCRKCAVVNENIDAGLFKLAKFRPILILYIFLKEIM